MVSLAYDTNKVSHFENLLKKSIPWYFLIVYLIIRLQLVLLSINPKVKLWGNNIWFGQGCRRIAHIVAIPIVPFMLIDLEGYKVLRWMKGIGYNWGIWWSTVIWAIAGRCRGSAAITGHESSARWIFAPNDTSGVSCIREIKRQGLKVPQILPWWDSTMIRYQRYWNPIWQRLGDGGDRGKHAHQ